MKNLEKIIKELKYNICFVRNKDKCKIDIDKVILIEELAKRLKEAIYEENENISH